MPRVCGFSDLGLVGLGLLGPALVFLCWPETCCGLWFLWGLSPCFGLQAFCLSWSCGAYPLAFVCSAFGPSLRQGGQATPFSTITCVLGFELGFVVDKCPFACLCFFVLGS